MTDLSTLGGDDPKDLAEPQPLYKMLRDSGAAIDLGTDGPDAGDGKGMVIVGGDADVRHVLAHPEVFSSGIDAVAIGQVRPLIPLQIDPPEHKNYRKLLDPIFAPRQMALLEDQTRTLVRSLIEPLVELGGCNFHEEVAEPLPTNVFLQSLGLPVSRAKEFIALKNGIIRPPVPSSERVAYTNEVGKEIYKILQDAIDQRMEERGDDFISLFLDAEVDGHRLTNDDVLDIGYVFFLAGLDTVTASLDCMFAYLGQHPEQRQRLVDDPSLIPHAIEEMLRWETPVPGVVRVTTEDTEVGGRPIDKGRVVILMLASANTDERAWPEVDTIDFDRQGNRHIAFGGGVHRCLGSHLARLELRIALEEWHRAIPEYRVPDDLQLIYFQQLRSVDNLELVWVIAAGERRLLIDGELTEASTGATFDNIDPFTEQVLGVVADGTRQDVERAVAAARTAFDTTSWSTDLELRKRCILQLQAALEGEREDLRAELVAEVGCPVLITYGPQLDAPLAEALTWPAEMIDRFEWTRSLGPKDPFGIGMNEREVWKEPVGVVGVIVPWNFPIEIILNKLGPILAMGNTCVLKPAPDTPWNATRIGRLIVEQTDIPPGVVNIVASSDHLVGEVLSTSPLVDMVAFTGSTATGRRIMAAAAETLKPTFLELGGKSINLVLDDADFESIIPSSSMVCFHGGQGCAMPTRLMVPRSRYDEAIELAAGGFATVAYGDPTDASNLMGPLVSSRQRDRVLGYIAQGKAEGARLLCGGGRPEHLPTGWFVEPTLFVDVESHMTIAQEEIFGPVLVMIPFDDDDDAVRIANDSQYGLSGMITSGDLDRAKSIARRVRTGTLGLNGGIWYGADAPFGGYKQSGIGRQCGIEGLEIYTETKTVGWPV